MRSLLHRIVPAYLDYIYRDTVRLRFRAQMDSLHGIKASKFLDCGCHAGHNTSRSVAQLNPDVTIGVEYGASFISVARERGIKVIQADLNRPIPLRSASIDVVTAYD